MNWILLFLGLALATLASLLPGSASLVCRILAVAVFVLGLFVAIAPMAATAG